MAILKISVLLLTALIAVQISTVESACCRSNLGLFGVCNDGTKGTPYCGYGKCNWVGCNCKGGCRTSSGKRNIETRAETVAKLRTLFKELDTDDSNDNWIDDALSDKSHQLFYRSSGGNKLNDNELTKREVIFSGLLSENQVDASFAERDINGDGKIALHEFAKHA